MQLQFTKGHGTGNDFVIFADPDAAVDLTPDRVRQLADRRNGVGGDGVIRAVRSDALAEGEGQAAQWFMDYRNADGSIGEMCGNGARVFARFLVETGLASLGADGSLPLATRAGVKTVRALGRSGATDAGGVYEVDLGGFEIEPGNTLVEAGGIDVARPGLGVDVGNAHVVVALATLDELASLDLQRAPVLDPARGGGANVEFVVPGVVTAASGALTMRVHERGSGETRSCGTGAVAAVAATRHWIGDAAPADWEVRVPGGTLGVRIRAGRALLSGPAALVYASQIEID